MIDLHMHTTVSDGTDTPAEILQHVKEAGISLFALTDHDAVKGCGIIRDLIKDGSLQFITGVEFSCKDEEGKYHVLGYGYDPEAPSVRAVVEKGHALRMEKVRGRLEFLKTTFRFTFPEEEVEKLLSLDNPGKPHIGNLMVQYGYAPSKEIAIKEFIDQAHFPNQYIRPEEAIEAILKGGGIPVLAHPPFGSGDQLILGEEMEQRLQKLTGFGLQGVEAFYSGFSPKLRDEELAFAEQFDLYVTAGSDYHGTNKMISLGDTGLPEYGKMPERLERFLDTVRYAA